VDVRPKYRDKAGLDASWLKDESLEESENLPDPDVLAQEIVEDLEAEQFREMLQICEQRIPNRKNRK
jgi:hypothetical protein